MRWLAVDGAGLYAGFSAVMILEGGSTAQLAYFGYYGLSGWTLMYFASDLR